MDMQERLMPDMIAMLCSDFIDALWLAIKQQLRSGNEQHDGTQDRGGPRSSDDLNEAQQSGEDERHPQSAMLPHSPGSCLRCALLRVKEEQTASQDNRRGPCVSEQ